MSQEIVDAVREIEREKGIESGTLVAALEDALLAAYKKTPGAARHATVILDDRGDFRVFAIELPPDLEVRLLDDARERAIDDLERIEEETGEKNHTLLSGLLLDALEIVDRALAGIVEQAHLEIGRQLDREHAEVTAVVEDHGCVPRSPGCLLVRREQRVFERGDEGPAFDALLALDLAYGVNDL